MPSDYLGSTVLGKGGILDGLAPQFQFSLEIKDDIEEMNSGRRFSECARLNSRLGLGNV
jgi:hypothetical protein